ncbi:unnamed protein product [Urochloa humidicola]
MAKANPATRRDSTSMSSSAAAAAAAADDDVERRACYGVAVSCASLVVFCVVAAMAGVVKAGAATGFTLLFLGVIGWFLPFGGASTWGWPWQWRRAAAARRRAAGASPAGCFCSRGAAPADVPPAFAYECPANAEAAADGKPGAGAMCAVCLEDVRRGEAVRRMPACGHVFHKECVDMWLESHVTCPLCRRELLPRACVAEKNVTVEVAAQASGDVLPPV